MKRGKRHAAGAAILTALLAAQPSQAADAPPPKPPETKPQSLPSGVTSAPPAESTEGGMAWWSPANLLPTDTKLDNASSRIFLPGTWTGDLDLAYDSYRQRTQIEGIPDSSLDGRLATTGVTVRNQGFAILDPRLLTGSLGLRFGVEKNWQEAFGARTTEHGKLIGYDLESLFLQEKPYNGTFLANQSQNVFSRSFGGTTRTENRSASLIFHWREDSVLREKEILPYFNANLEVRQEHLKERTANAGQTFDRDEHRDLVRLNGHNGWTTADLDFSFEGIRLDNIVYPAGSYRSETANVDYSLDFGPGLNRRWDNHVTYSSRKGTSEDLTLLTLGERLNIDHYDNLSSNYYYDFTSQQVLQGSATSNSLGAGLNHRLYQNLNSSVGVSGARLTLPTGDIDTAAVQAAFDYNHAVPLGGNLSTWFAGAVAFTENKLQSSVVPVVDASYIVPPQLGAGTSILLADRNIVTDTIVVVDVKGGSRITTVEGVDYTVLVEGDQTRILPQPTSAIIVPGDLLEISYVFNVDPSSKFRTDSRSVGLDLDWRWIAFSVAHEETLQTPLAGTDSSFLSDRRRDSAKMQLRGDWDALSGRADAGVTRYNYTQLVYDEVRFGEQVTYRFAGEWLPGSWLFDLSANQVRADYELPVRRSDGRSVTLNVDWNSYGGWWVNGSLSHRTLRDTELPSDDIKEAMLRVRRTWYKLDIFGSVGYADRLRGGVHTTNANLHFSAVRRF
jgi:hypothetical protein